MQRSLILRILILCLLLVGGGLSAFVAGDRLEGSARDAWQTRAAQETERITATYLFWLTTYQAQLRGAAALFHASSEVNENELLDALDVIEGLEAAIPLETVAFIHPTDQGWIVTVSTDLDGPVASGATVEIPQMVGALESALDLPDRVVMGIPFDEAGRKKSLLAIAAPNAGQRGAVVSMVDVTGLLEGLQTLHVPAGLELSLTAEHETAGRRQVDEIWSSAGSELPSTRFTYASDSGQVHWRFEWDVMPDYRGGPDLELARVVEYGSLIVVALVGIVITLLFRQNLRVKRQVEERTAELHASVIEAQAANRSKSVFLANVSHEIRTPLNAIMGFADVLDRQLKDPSQRQHLHVMQESAAHLLQIITGILDLSRLEAGQLTLQPAPTDALAIFTDLGRVYRPRARDQQTDLQIKIEPSLPPVLVIDGARLREVLAPLVDNALKFTRGGHVVVRALGAPVSGGIDLTVRVTDTGVGIPADQQDRIFELFRQRDGQSINEYGGTGLGLTIARQLVELMDGSIAVQSEVGKGSTFEIRIPAVAVGDHDLIDDLSRRSVPEGAEETHDATPGVGAGAVGSPIPEIAQQLLVDETTRWRHLMETQTINDIEEFAQDLVNIGTEHEVLALQQLGQRLQEQTSVFDLAGMQKSLASFTDFLPTDPDTSEETLH